MTPSSTVTPGRNIYATCQRYSRQANLKVKARKCQFARNHCDYLGYVIGEGKIRLQACKIASVQDFPQPQTKKDVRAFLGLAGYYRRFMKDFATIAAPLSDLTKVSLPNRVDWRQEHEKAFRELKKQLTADPVLREVPTSLTPFCCKQMGIGSVLSQLDENGDEHPVAYASRKLLPRERRYAAVEKEYLAVVEGIRTFRVYLEGRQFQVQTDHRSLQYLNQMRDHNGRLARWSLYLQPFDFVIAHRPGKHNGNADGLSRAPTTSIFEGGGDVRDH